ncbi:MAG: hypothetical protein FJ276_34715, partial [Planctomycetes bacterium]|nr:hypothetical protein [Planctomycetota bacterium]
MAGIFRTVLGMWCVGCLAASCALAANAADEAKERAVVSAALAGPMEDVTEVVFAARLPYDDPHWYANIGYFCDDERQKAYAGNGRPDVGKLCKVNIRTGDVTTLVDDPGGSIRDPQVHYDGRKVLFAFRRSGTDCYHLYEVGVDGSDLRQITGGAYDDYEPCYLPDGGIAFVSTRCNCWVNCWKTQVGVIYRCDADGGNIRRLSYSGEHDNTPWVLPDGRILYTRWEYVDRSQVEFHHLWTMNPDGTAQAILFGNMHPGIVMIDAKPIPGSRNILAGFSPGHGMTDHRGTATIVSPAGGPDDRSSARPIPGWPHVEDPYALSDDCFLAAQAKQILVGDAAGNRAVLYRWQGEGNVREPRPVRARVREPVIPSRVDWTEPTGRMILSDIYASRHMAGV